MREGWELRALGELYEIGSSKRVHKRDWSDHGVPFYRAREIVKLAQQGHVDNELFITEKLFDEHKAKTGAPCEGDLMVTAVGTLGVSYVVESNDRFYFKDASVLWFRPKVDIDSRFMEYAFLSPQIRNQTTDSQGATVGTLTISRAKSIKILLPPLPEQKRIVAILDEAFAGIEAAIANTEKNLANARELFESYLNSVFLRNDHAWTKVKLESVCKKITVGHVGSMAKRYKPEGIPLLRSQNIRPFRVELDKVVYIDQEFHQELRKSALTPGDLGVVRTGYPGTAAVIPDSLPIANCSDLVIVRPGDQVFSDFLAVVFNSNFGKRAVAGVLVGAAQKHFNVTAAKAALIPIPSKKEQERIVSESNEVREECEKLQSIYQQKLTALAELKQSLLQKAFSGELTADKAQCKDGEVFV